MKNQRLRQFGVSFLIVLSLLASSISACACAHHHEISAAENSCHQHFSETVAAPHHAQTAAHESIGFSAAENDCCCVSPAPKTSAKSEIVKIEKQSPIVSNLPRVETETIPQVSAANIIVFAAPFYLADSFHNLSPGRAPPRS